MSKETSAEDNLIARHFAPLATDPGALGLTDDAAFIKPPAGCELVLKADAIVSGIHFFPDDAPDTIAGKALRINLSDLASKGAKPLGFLLSLALPSTIDDAWLAAFAQGLREDIATYKCPLFGGDTVRSPGPVMVSVAMFGSVPDGMMVKRSTAKPGDKVFVTGSIGDSALGLGLRKGATWPLTDAQRDHLAMRYLLPLPRTSLAETVLHYVSAAMDVSDGLVGDLAKLCRASGVSASIDAARVPLSPAAKTVISTDPTMLETALTGGDDYEILCTVSPAKADRFRVAAMAARVAVTEIGAISEGEGTVFHDAQGLALAFKRASFSHF